MTSASSAALPVEVLQALSDRIDRALVSLHIGEPPSGKDIERLYIASGVLVRLGGVLFVFTAGHNLYWEEEGRAETVTVLALPRNMPVIAPFGDGSVKSTWFNLRGGKPDPDVGVIELSESMNVASDVVPFEEDEIGFLASDAPERDAVLGGFPNKATIQEGYFELEKIGRYFGMVSQPIILKTPTRPRRRSDFEPKEGRGVHVYVARFHQNAEGVKVSIPHPEGMSGGPLVVAGEGGKPLLVALARSVSEVEGRRDEWCEPVVEAVQLLAADHESQRVKDAAVRILKRCGFSVRGVDQDSRATKTWRKMERSAPR